jgi:hypothetical protein
MPQNQLISFSISSFFLDSNDFPWFEMFSEII